MKLATINKLPEESKERIYYVWGSVYVEKDFDREEAFQFVAGIIAGLSHAGIISKDEQRELFSYYKQWFSL